MVLKLFSSEPRLAIALANRENLVIPKDVYDYLVSWINDVGGVMRSREFMVSSVASYASYRIMLSASNYLPVLEFLMGLKRKGV